MQTDPEKKWQKWCENNPDWLAQEFLRRMDQGEDLRPFFGSWFSLRGQKQTGYFPGQQLLTALEKQMNLSEIAAPTNVENHLRPLLTQLW